MRSGHLKKSFSYLSLGERWEILVYVLVFGYGVGGVGGIVLILDR